MSKQQVPTPGPPPARQAEDDQGAGKTSGSEQATGLPLPHERDQAPDDGTPKRQRQIIEQAAEDIESGQVDTDLHNRGGLDERRRKKLLDEDGR